MSYYYTNAYKSKVFMLLLFFLFFYKAFLPGQEASPVFARQVSTVLIEGAWEVDFSQQDEKFILRLEQTGTIAIGTFDKAPVIVNVGGDKIKFRCDMKDDRGSRVRYNIVGEIGENGKMFGTCMIHHKRDNTFIKSDWEAVRVE